MMEDQAASLRRLTPGAQMGRSFAFLGVPGGGTTTLLADLAAWLRRSYPTLTGAQWRW